MVLFYLPNLKAGGAQRVMLNVLKYLYQKKVFDIVLLLGERNGVLTKELPAELPIHFLDKSSGLAAMYPFIRFCRQYHPAIVITTLSVTGSLSKPFIGKKTNLINRLGNTIGAEKKLRGNSLQRYLYVKVNHLMSYLSDVTIFQCDYMKEDYINTTGFTPLHSKVIYNPVDIAKINKLAGEPADMIFDLVAVGRLQLQKDYLTLLEACSLLKKNYGDFTLAILGEGEQRKVLEDYIHENGLAENVFLMGYQANPYNYVKAAKYLVSSSLYEGFSNVIVEALCIGTPILATNCPGANAEVLEEDVNAYTCKVSDSVDLASIMERGLRSYQLFDREKIKQEASNRYNLEKIAASYIDVINSQFR